MPDTQTPPKKLQILEAATALIREYGIQAISFERIASQSGQSRQLVRYYFTDLDRLIAELSDFLAAGYRDMLIAGIVEIGAPQRLDFFLDFFFELAEGRPLPDNLEVYDALVAYAVGSDLVRDRLRGQYLTLGQVVAHELAITHPGLGSRATEELSFLFVSLMHAHWSFVATLGYSRDHCRLTRGAMDRLIASYVADPAATPGLERPWAHAG